MVTEATACVLKCFSESERVRWMEEQIHACLQADCSLSIRYPRLTALLSQFPSLFAVSPPLNLIITDCLPFVLQTTVACSSLANSESISCISWITCVKRLVRILLSSASEHLQPLLNKTVLSITSGCDHSFAVLQELVLYCNLYHMWIYHPYISCRQFTPIHEIVRYLSQSVLPSCDKENGFCQSASILSGFLQLLKYGSQIVNFVDDLPLELLIQLCVSALCSFQRQLIRDVSSFLEMIIVLNTDERVVVLVQSYSTPIIRSCVGVELTSPI